MRSPGGGASHRAGRHFEEELSLTYLSPGAFTVLTPQEYGNPPDPPSAPSQYRLLTPNTRRRRSQAFSIIAETSSNPGSRSPSPSGRVSPFRGRGFNPIGSRHASPNPSPPPEDVRIPSSTHPKHNVVHSAKKSHIPQPTQRGGGSLPGGQVTKSPKFRRKNGSKLSPHLSKSLTNISPKNVAAKPPRSPNRHKKFSKRPAFEQLSPITGSSPETDSKDKSQSSPSKIPRSSRSQPVSRKSSPTRTLSPNSKHSSMSNSRTGSKTNSRNASRDPSPSKAHTKIPVKNSSTKTSSNKSKPKVPPKPQEISGKSGERTKPGSSKLKRNESVGKFKNGKADDSKIKSGKKSGKKLEEGGDESAGNTTNGEKSKHNTDSSNTPERGAKEEDVGEMRKNESSGALSDIASATTVVSSTTSTATQPLKIETNLDNIIREELNKTKNTYMGDDQLSANSVSSAMNKMNDTVLNSQSLMRDHNFTKLSPAASAIISLSSEGSRESKALDTKSATTALPTIESIHKKMDDVGQNINNSFADSNKVHMESIENTVKNNISKITPDHKLGISGPYVQKSANERIRDARTVVAADVKPIKILVKEKPMDIEVQSGNVRLPVSATNGLNVLPGLPPPQQPDNNSSGGEEGEGAKQGCCAKLFRCCRCASCKSCRKTPSNREMAQKKSKGATGCFGYRKKKQEAEEVITSSTNLVDEAKQKSGCLGRLKCCKSKKVGDTGCCPRGKRKDSWVDKRDNVWEAKKPTGCRDRCKAFFKKIFCCSSCCRCCKKKVEEDALSRRESMMSKKKSLTPTIAPVDLTPKIDQSLVEHMSLMRGAIPVLPVPLAWVCLIFNIFLPGIGTVLSGMFCLCLGKPRFSQHDGPRPRFGAFLIDLIIGCGQLFTVLFCLVGWGWSIWWGVIMLKIARKHKRIRLVEERALERPVPVVNENHHSRDPERGS